MAYKQHVPILPREKRKSKLIIGPTLKTSNQNKRNANLKLSKIKTIHKTGCSHTLDYNELEKHIEQAEKRLTKHTF